MRFAYADDSGYATLGLSGNPFVAESEPGVAADLWISRDGVPPPSRPGQRRLVQLIGPKGAGKTSHLLRWRSLAPGPYHYVPLGPGRWRRPPVAPLVYWDEVDRLAGPVRAGSLAYAAARGATVVAGTHDDLAGIARACGLAVSTYRFTALTAAVVQEWAALRIAATALPGRTPSLELDDATARVICERAGASLRDAALELHVWAAERAREAAPGRPPRSPGE